MKLFKKLMAGAMAIAMLSAYVVAFASTNSGSTVSGAGIYAGSSSPVFVMTLPTADTVGNSLAFTIDPQKILYNSKPADTDASSTFGTVVFQTTSGAAGGTQTTIYKNESEPMKVISQSSVDVTVSMLAYLSDTKMKIFEGTPTTTSSGISFPSGNKDHIYFGLSVKTISGGVSAVSGAAGGSGVRIISGGSAQTSTTTVTAMGAKNKTVLKAIPDNFETTISGGKVVTSVKSGGTNPTLTVEDSWNSAEYTVKGMSNSDADWDIAGIAAPNLTIKWMVDPASELTYPVTATGNSTYTIQLDKDAYKKNDTVNIYIKPTSSTQKLKTVTFKYISLKADGTMDKEVALKAKVVGTVNDSGTTVATATNGVYQAILEANFPDPGIMAKNGSPAGNIATFNAPYFEVTLG